MAEGGDALAQCNLGIYYKNEIVVKKDLNKACSWTEKSANLGNSKAQFILGVIYEKGEGVSKSYEKAIEYYKRSLDGGFHDHILANLDNEDSPIPTLGNVTIKIHEILKSLQVDDENPPSLTDFTTLSTFEEIVKKKSSGKLRLQNIDGCNDPVEDKTLFEWRKIYGVNTPVMVDRYPSILSLCEGSPENLPMWDTYAKDSTSVGFSLLKKSIKELAECKDLYAGNFPTGFSNEKETNKDKKPNLYNVLYLPRKNEANKSTKSDVIERLYALNTKIEDKSVIDELDSLKEEIIKNDDLKEHLPKLLIELAHVAKYDDYQYEKEVRLVRFAFKSDITDVNITVFH